MGATVQPSRILRELEELWVELAAHSEGGGTQGVLRSCSLTLIVLSRRQSGRTALEETLGVLMEAHPARVISIQMEEGGARSVDARVTAQCWLPFGKRQQICSERVEITATSAALGDLPPVLRALTVPDLPVVLYCRDWELLDSREFTGLLAATDKLIVNSAGCGEPLRILRHLSAGEEAGVQVADLSWTRLTRWRETIAQVFVDPARRRSLEALEAVTVSHYGARPPLRALYLAAWLKNTIGDHCRYAFAGSGRAPCQRLGEVESVSLSGPHTAISISQLEGEDVELRDGELVRRMVFPEPNDSQLLREELAIEGPDTIFEAARETAIALDVLRAG